jgi:hypothetical protein
MIRRYLFSGEIGDETRVLGGTGLNPRIGPDAREIGYWLPAFGVGQGLMTAVVGALTRVALKIDRVARVEIHCDPDKVPSAPSTSILGRTVRLMVSLLGFLSRISLELREGVEDGLQLRIRKGEGRADRESRV